MDQKAKYLIRSRDTIERELAAHTFGDEEDVLLFSQLDDDELKAEYAELQGCLAEYIFFSLKEYECSVSGGEFFEEKESGEYDIMMHVLQQMRDQQDQDPTTEQVPGPMCPIPRSDSVLI